MANDQQPTPLEHGARVRPAQHPHQPGGGGALDVGAVGERGELRLGLRTVPAASFEMNHGARAGLQALRWRGRGHLALPPAGHAPWVLDTAGRTPPPPHLRVARHAGQRHRRRGLHLRAGPAQQSDQRRQRPRLHLPRKLESQRSYEGVSGTRRTRERDIHAPPESQLTMPSNIAKEIYHRIS